MFLKRNLKISFSSAGPIGSSDNIVADDQLNSYRFKSWLGMARHTDVLWYSETVITKKINSSESEQSRFKMADLAKTNFELNFITMINCYKGDFMVRPDRQKHLYILIQLNAIALNLNLHSSHNMLLGYLDPPWICSKLLW